MDSQKDDVENSGKNSMYLPKLVNVAHFRSKHFEPVLLHFTAKQWVESLEKMREISKRASNFKQFSEHATFEAVPMPGERGAMIIGSRRPCPQGTIWSAMRVLSTGDKGYIPDPENTEMIQPACLEVPDRDDSAQLPPQPPQCYLVFRLGVGGLRLTCVKTSCPFSCFPGATTPLPDGRVLIGCGCYR
jgi:hypothetical protein